MSVGTYVRRWWVNLGVIEKLRFSRDRMVESFMYAGGVAFEPQYGSLRKWLSKVIKLVLIIDDICDVYGSLDELECFSKAVDRFEHYYYLYIHSEKPMQVFYVILIN